MNSERSTSSNTLYILIWYEIYLRLKQRCRKFGTVVNSGIEEAYMGKPYVSLGKTIDLKNVIYIWLLISLFAQTPYKIKTLIGLLQFTLNMLIKPVITL